MGPRELARWQWSDYAAFHRTRRNLAVHVVAVPLFLLGNLAAAAGVALPAWWLALGGLALSAAAFAAQGLGHKGEPSPPKPFTGPLNVAGRMFVEQWVTFPRFVLSGGWRRNWVAATDARPRRRRRSTVPRISSVASSSSSG